MADTNLPSTGNYDNVQAELARKRAELGQSVANVTNIQGQYSPTNDPEITALRSQHADKVKQLFDYDSKLAPVYFQPQAAPAVAGETVEQPGQRIIDPLIGMRSSSTQTQATASELADILSRIGKRKDTLTENMDKALTLFKYGLQIKQMEMDSLEKELDRIDKKSSGGKGASDLTALFNAITGVQNKKSAITPKATGKVKNKEELMKIAKQYGGQIDYQQNADGTFSWAVRKENQEFVTPEEATTYEDVPALIKKLGAATVAGGNASPSEVNSIIESFIPKEVTETQYKSKEESRNILRQNIINMPKGTDFDTALRILIVNHPELTASEIQEELDVMGIK